MTVNMTFANIPVLLFSFLSLNTYIHTAHKYAIYLCTLVTCLARILCVCVNKKIFLSNDNHCRKERKINLLISFNFIFYVFVVIYFCLCVYVSQVMRFFFLYKKKEQNYNTTKKKTMKYLISFKTFCIVISC